MQFKNKVVVITGGASGIGRTIAEEFQKEKAKVCIIDKKENPYFVGDISQEEILKDFVNKIISEHKKVDILVNNAMLSRGGISDCSYDDFNYVMQVGVSAPFYLAKLLAPHFSIGGSIINISSTRAYMSQENTESYTAAKGGILALTHALAVSMAGRVRVNSISPGWIDTDFKEYEGADAKQHLSGRVGNPKDISNMVKYLCSDKAGFVTGEDICIDGGMTKQMIYNNDFGWKLEE